MEENKSIDELVTELVNKQRRLGTEISVMEKELPRIKPSYEKPYLISLVVDYQNIHVELTADEFSKLLTRQIAVTKEQLFHTDKLLATLQEVLNNG